MTGLPRVTFGMIVLNGEPFLRYNLRALYPFAHEIIVVEGAAPGGAAIADARGHSTDGTLETLRHFQAEEDPKGKLKIVTAEDEGHRDGFWPGEKHEQSRAYAQRATGDYLWQVDVDEFYKAGDMHYILSLLQSRPQVTAVSFEQIQFWGGFNYYVDGWFLRRGAGQFHRLFRWGPGYRYVTHRPPTVESASGVNVRDDVWLSAADLGRLGIYLYHYSFVFPRQVREKSSYYGNAQWAKRPGAVQWVEDAYLQLRKPYRLHNVYRFPGWLERFEGTHPSIVTDMMNDIVQGELKVEVRPTDDIEQLLSSPWYALGRFLLKWLEPVDAAARGMVARLPDGVRCRLRKLLGRG